MVGAVVAWVGLLPWAGGVEGVGAEPSGVNQGRIAIVAVGVKAKTAEPVDSGFWVAGDEAGSGALAAVAGAEESAAVTAAAEEAAVAVAAAAATAVAVGICWRVKRGRRVD